MNIPTESERKEWWLYCHAHISLRRALETCDILLSTCESNRDTLFPSLSLAIHGFYGRPFKCNRGVGKLPENIVPKENKGIHDWLMDFRDSTMLHTDSTEKEAGKGKYHELIYSNYGEERIYSTFELPAPVKAYQDTSIHIEKMLNIVLVGVARIHEKFEDIIPKDDGDFLFQVDRNPLFIPHAVRDHIKLNYPPATTIGD